MTKQVRPRKTTSGAASRPASASQKTQPLGVAAAGHVGESPGRPEMLHRVTRRRRLGSMTTAIGRARRRRGAAQPRLRLAVDQFLQFLARLEVRHLLRRNVHLVARLRVAPLARLAPPQPEAAEPAQLDLLAAVQRVDDALEDGVDDDLRVLLREVRNPRDFLDELRFRHAAGVHSASPPASQRQRSCSSSPARSQCRCIASLRLDSAAASCELRRSVYCWCLK